MKGAPYDATEIAGVVLLLVGTLCLGAWLHEEIPIGPQRLPQLALSGTFLGFLLWSIGRSGRRGER